MLDRSEIGKRGYLEQDFRLVHLKDSLAQRIDYHYHEFDKLVFFLGGKVAYVVEGVTYFLQPWDIVLVQHNMIHRPIIDASEPYERAVLWLGRNWLEARSDPGEPLDACFDRSREGGFHLLRTAEEGGWAMPGPSSSWRRPSGPRSSVPAAWRTPCASSC